MVEMDRIDDALAEFSLYLQTELEDGATLQSYSASIILVGGLLQKKSLEAAFQIYTQGLRYNFEMNPVNLFEFGDITFAMLRASRSHHRLGYLIKTFKDLVDEFMEQNLQSNALDNLLFRIRLAYQSMDQSEVAIQYIRRIYEILIHNYPEHYAVNACACHLVRLYCFDVKRPYEYLAYLLKVSPPALDKLENTDGAYLMISNISSVLEELIKGPLGIPTLRKKIKKLKKNPSCSATELIQLIFRLKRTSTVLLTSSELFKRYHHKIHSSLRVSQVKDLINTFSLYAGELDKLTVMLNSILSLKKA